MNCSMLKVMRTSSRVRRRGWRRAAQNGLWPEGCRRASLTVVLVPPLAGFYSYFSGVPLHLLASKKEDNEAEESVRRTQRLAGIGPGPHAGGLRRGRRHPGNPQGRARLGRGRAAAQNDAAAGAPRLDGARSHAARPHPRSIRSGPGRRDRPGPRSVRARPANGVPRAEAGRQRLEGRSPGGFLQSWTWDPRRTISWMPWCNWSSTRTFSTRPKNTAKRCRKSSCSCRACRAGRPQRRQPGHQQPQAVGHPPGGDRRASCRGQEDLFRQERVVQDPGGPVGEAARSKPTAPRSILTRRPRTPGAG